MAEGTSVWERHLQSGLLGLLSVASIAIASATIQAREDIAVVKSDVRYIQISIGDKMADRWTASDHRAYSEFDTLRVENLRKDIERNTSRIKGLEDSIGGSD